MQKDMFDLKERVWLGIEARVTSVTITSALCLSKNERVTENECLASVRILIICWMRVMRES